MQGPAQATDTSPDPQVWIPAIRAGEVAAFEALFRTLYPPLTHYLRRVAGEDVAEELAQDVFVAVWEHRLALDPARPIRGYVFRAAHNRAANHTRRRQLEHRILDRLAAGTGCAPPVEYSAADELATALGVAVAALPPRCRQVYGLSRESNLSHSEIARRLGLSVKTVENHLGRALRALRSALATFLD